MVEHLDRILPVQQGLWQPVDICGRRQPGCGRSWDHHHDNVGEKRPLEKPMTWSIIAQITKCHHHLSHLAPYTGEEESPLQSFWSSQGALGHRCWKFIMTTCVSELVLPFFNTENKTAFRQPECPSKKSSDWLKINFLFGTENGEGQKKYLSIRIQIEHEMIGEADLIFGICLQFVFCY